MSQHDGHPEPLERLLARCRAGNPDALDTLVRRFYPFASSLAASLLRHPDRLDDVVQSAFVTVLSHLRALRTADAFPGWLRQIIRTQCARLARDHPAVPIDDRLLSPATGPAQIAAGNELRQIIRHAIGDLPPAQRQTAELFYLEELPHSHVARALSIPEGTVKRRLHDARLTLRTRLKSQFPL